MPTKGGSPMGDTERPVTERLGDQDEQAAHLTRTGNGPSVEDEAELLYAAYGQADMAGYYTGSEVEGAELVDEDELPGEDVEQVEAPADDTAAGGASA